MGKALLQKQANETNVALFFYLCKANWKAAFDN
jgi:hypothetical protein